MLALVQPAEVVARGEAGHRTVRVDTVH